MTEYIDKDKAINAVFEAFADGRSAYIALEAIPAADVAPVRHGWWNVYSAKHGLYSCSECHCVPAFLHSPYCPNCGAEMDGEV